MKTYLCIVILFLVGQGYSQSIREEKMKELSSMVGKWEGGGWYMDRSGVRSEFTQKEDISYELGGTAILIKGRGKRGEEVIHDAMAIIRYDSVSGYSMFSMLSDGKETNATFEILDDKIEWWFDVPTGRVKYTIVVDGEKWTEKGAYSPDKENWYPFIGFTLTKK